MTNFKQQWIQIGVELEGSWFKSRESVAALVRGAQAHKDLSVHIGQGNPGEIVTRPHDDLNMLCDDIVALWPDIVNDSCGFHIHASFSPMNGSIIASKEFYDYFKEEWGAWGRKLKLPRDHEFWVRLAGRNKHAKDRFDPEGQLVTFQGKAPDARYTMLNFHSWEKHKTIECRLLPMFSERELGVSAVRQMAWIYDSYLNNHGFPSFSLEPSSAVVGDTALETYESVIPDLTPLEYLAEDHHVRLEVGDDIYYGIPGATDDMLPHRTDSGKTMP